jgi:hypothetical protein
MAGLDDELRPPPRRTGIISSAARIALLPLVGPMERVGMNPQRWFAIAARPPHGNDYHSHDSDKGDL